MAATFWLILRVTASLILVMKSNCQIGTSLVNLNLKAAFPVSLHVFKNVLKQTLISLLQTTFDMECPYTWSLARACDKNKIPVISAMEEYQHD